MSCKEDDAPREAQRTADAAAIQQDVPILQLEPSSPEEAPAACGGAGLFLLCERTVTKRLARHEQALRRPGQSRWQSYSDPRGTTWRRTALQVEVTYSTIGASYSP